MKKFAAVILSLALALSLCACGGGTTTQPDAEPSTGTAEEAASTADGETAAEGETAEAGEEETASVALPEDDGMVGVYKWTEMEDYGVPAYLILWDDGSGAIDMVGTGTVTAVSYDDETMQAADEGAVPQSYTYADDTLTWTYTDEDGEHISTFVKLTADERAAYEALGVGSVAETGDEGETVSSWPEDTGGMAGVYKWAEMADIGINANLILWDDGVGLFDMLGVVETVEYDEETMQTSGEGALPQSYTYADGTLTWTAVDDDGETVSTFVKLTAEELAEYQARGIGNAE